jgi:fido (protein-threonine AMPylation protein)
VKSRIDNYYKSETVRNGDTNDRTEEADKVSARIAEILSERTFTFSPLWYINIHRRLFLGIYKFAGKIRDYNITKSEWVLDGKTVFYSDADMISATLDYDFKQEKEFSYKKLNQTEIVEHIAKFISGLWQIHAFGEGNTRTTAVFAIKYLRTFGYNVDNGLFAKHSWYFRNALVRANFNDFKNNIKATTEYLMKFFGNLLFGEANELKNRTMHIRFKEQDLQIHKNSNAGENDNPKDFEEENEDEKLGVRLGIKLGIKLGINQVEILEQMQRNPNITITELSAILKITETAVENNLNKLKKLNIVERIGARKNGSWKING